MKNYLKILQFFRQISLGLLAMGGVLYLDKIHFSIFLLTVGGLGFAFYCFLSAFKPIHEEPNWELVYPELALGYSDDLDVEPKKENNHETGK